MNVDLSVGAGCVVGRQPVGANRLSNDDRLGVVHQLTRRLNDRDLLYDPSGSIDDHLQLGVQVWVAKWASHRNAGVQIRQVAVRPALVDLLMNSLKVALGGVRVSVDARVVSNRNVGRKALEGAAECLAPSCWHLWPLMPLWPLVLGDQEATPSQPSER